MDYEKIKIAVYDITDDVKSQIKIAVYSLPKFIEEINLAPEFMDFDLENVRFEIEKEN